MRFSNKDLIHLILPLVVEQTLLILVGMVDVIMIAHVGEAAVSGVSLVDNINILIINVFAALATGGAVVAGHALGKKDEQEACRAGWQLMLFSVSVSTIVTLLFIAFHNSLLTAIFGKVEAEVMESAKTYLVITAISIVPLAIYDGCAALFRAFGNSKVTMYISAFMNLTHIVLNAILIYGFHMGVRGAAISTSVSRTLAAVVIFVLLLNPKRKIHFTGFMRWRPDFALLKKILYIGVPNGVENSLFQLGKILLISLVATFGTSSIAANAVGNTIAGFNVLPGLAVNLALISVVSVCVGAGDYEQARYYTKKLMKAATLIIAVLSAIVIVLIPAILKIYQLSPETSQIAKTIIIYHAIMAILFWMPSFSISNTLRASGDTVWTMSISILSMWLFRIVTAYLISYFFELGLFGVWIAMTIDWIFRSICYVTRFRGKKWENCMKKREITA